MPRSSPEKGIGKAEENKKSRHLLKLKNFEKKNGTLGLH